MRPVSGIRVKTLTGSDGSDSPAALTVFAMRAPTPAGPLLGAVADRVRGRLLLVAVDIAVALLPPTLLLLDSADRVWSMTRRRRPCSRARSTGRR
ncbi:hypothetical protein ABZ611_26855 [Streptomyces sp. NPDC007861]|uniref:hypothetical protein n=1 Tax=Streptomyces sp. NPDC007861 TaxID=3154893 RepID=UPI0033D5A386